MVEIKCYLIKFKPYSILWRRKLWGRLYKPILQKNYESNGEIIAYGGTTSVNIKFDWAAIGGDGGAGSITVKVNTRRVK